MPPPITPDGRPWPSQEECTLAKATAISSKLRPLGDRVVIKPTAREEMTKSGIVLPDTVKEKPQEGTIIAAGPGKILEDGKRETMDVKEGDKVFAAAKGNPQGADGMAEIPDGQLDAVIESAEECPGECIFLEIIE